MRIPNLLYNAQAYFAASEQYGDGFIDALLQNNVSGLVTLAWALAELSKQAELLRRDMGEDRGEIHDQQWFLVRLSPADIVPAKDAVLNAIARGMNMPDAGEEVDEVLAELQKKKVKN